MNSHYLLSFIFLSILYHPVEVLRTDLAQNTANYSSKFERPDVDLHAQFKDYVTRFNRSYLNDPKEYSNRKYIFKESLIRQFKLNEKEKKLGGSAVYGVNMFSDMTPQEFQEFLKRGQVMSSQRLLSNTRDSEVEACKIPQGKDMPTHWNWHEKGKVTSIKNQGKCGSCWAFTAVEVVESQWAIKHDELKDLSVQELISCGAGLGCSGGNTCSALNWLVLGKISNKTVRYTLAPDSECPYEDKDTQCDNSLKHSKSGVTIKYPCCKNDVDELTYMKPVIAFFGTMAVNVDATMWHDYISGIIQHHCSDEGINHAVQIVGYDTTGVVPYWIVRNSWGTVFGDKGYLYIEMGKKLCGVQKEATFVVV